MRRLPHGGSCPARPACGGNFREGRVQMPGSRRCKPWRRSGASSSPLRSSPPPFNISFPNSHSLGPFFLAQSVGFQERIEHDEFTVLD